MNEEIKEYLSKVDGVSHITFNPNGLGVCRVHLIPPKKPKVGISWVAIVNGTDILPLSTGWAILLREFIEEAYQYDGMKEVTEDQVDSIVTNTLNRMSKIFPRTKKEYFKKDLKEIIDTLNDVAIGKMPEEKIGYMTLDKYAKYMGAPHRMDLMISSMERNGSWNCNQKCIHCYAGVQKEAVVDELSTAEWKNVIDKVKSAMIPQVTFTGGEPTLRGDLVELVEYSKWFVTRLNTNGIRLTESLCHDLYEASLDSVQVTLYSDNESIHNVLTGSNHFKDTVEGIRNAVSSNLNVSINTPLCTLNKDYVSLLKFGKSLGIKYFTCSGIIMTGNAENDTSTETYLDKDAMYQILKDAANYAEENGLEIQFTSPGWVESEKLKGLGLTSPMCGACLSNMAIAPNGDVLPCQSYLSSESLGNILDTKFEKIWESRKCKEIRAKSTRDLNHCQLQKREVI